MPKESAKLPYLKTVETNNTYALTKDGEIYSAEKKLQVVIEEDSGFMLMCNYMFGLINGLDSVVDIKVMTCITESLVFNENVVTLNKYTKAKIIEHTGYSNSAIERSIGVLTKKGYLVRDTVSKRSGTYHVNPTYVWHGDREKRKGKLKMVLEIMQFQNMPDREREREEDIKRFQIEDKKANKKK